MSKKQPTFETGDVPKVGYFRNIPDEFKIKSLYSNDLILNIASKSKETVQKLKFLDSPSRPEVYTDVHFWTVYFKRLTEEYALRYAVAAKKLILNVSEPPWTAVVLRRSEFACELVAHECTGRTFVGEDVRGSTQ